MSTPNQAQILVIDDEPDLRTLYELTLLREGYRVEAAADLAQARTQLKGRHFDAVITDMRLPDSLDLELLREMVSQQRSERCVAMTAHGPAENAVEALKAGAFDYLTKPVDLKQFPSVVASAIQGPAHALAAGDPERGRPETDPARPGNRAPGVGGTASTLQRLVGRICRESGFKVPEISAQALALGEDGDLHLESPTAEYVAVPENLQAFLDGQERNILCKVLQETGFNRTAAAAKLGISLRQIRYRIARLNIVTPHSDDAPDDVI